MPCPKHLAASRREFVVAAGGAAAGCALSGCGAPPPMMSSHDMKGPADMKSCGSMPVPDASRLKVNQVFYVSENKIFIVRDDRGFMAVSGYCTHSGCDVAFNDVDRTYDCPCHGSRYEIDGAVRNGPATMHLNHYGLCRDNGVLVVNLTMFLPDISQRTP